MSFVTVLFALVNNVFMNKDTNYGLVIETKVQGDKHTVTGWDCTQASCINARIANLGFTCILIANH